ncbi:hypothetical protein QVD17_17614 [Tagetes erecta]|uniref:Uncharacterized protein n=1 Tax=Tagetes erecta TaxID=13708 RepID=A0AAD8KSK5_TARER|nr:hypothetical protein QVD17_17614 [Tagetes erecta]
MNKTMSQPRRGQIKRKIVIEIVNSVVYAASMATNMMMKKKRIKTETYDSSTCMSSPVSSSDADLISDEVSGSDLFDLLFV